MTKRYKKRPGFHVKIPAQVLGEFLDKLADGNGGALTAAVVVEAAKDPEAAIHDEFIWDDSEAARQQREDTARKLMRSLLVVIVNEEATPQEAAERATIGWVSVNNDAGERAYRPIEHIHRDHDMERRMLADALRMIESMRARFKFLSDASEILDAFDTFEAVVRARHDAARPAATPALTLNP